MLPHGSALAHPVAAVDRGTNLGRLPRAEDAEGIKVGQRSTFHPGFALAVGFDSNVFYTTSPEPIRRAAFLLPTAWVGIGNRQVRDGMLMTPAERTARVVDYNVSLVAGFRQYLSSLQRVLRQSRFNVGLLGRAAFLPGRSFSVHVDEDLYRMAEPRNVEAGQAFNFNRVDHRGSVTLIGRPGGGRISLAFGYLSQALFFENGDDEIRRNNRLVNGAMHETKWRFFPKSSILARYTFHHTLYTACCQDVGEGRNEDNFAHRVLAGFRGQLGKKFVLEVLPGWGGGFYRDDPTAGDGDTDFNSFIGRASLDYFPTRKTQLTVEAERSFQDSLFGNYYIDNGGRFSVRHTFKWRMFGIVGVGVFDRQYRALPEPLVEDLTIDSYRGESGTRRRRDLMFTGFAKIEQSIGRFFAVALQYRLIVDRTDFVTVFVDGFENYAGYIHNRLMAFGAVRF